MKTLQKIKSRIFSFFSLVLIKSKELTASLSFSTKFKNSETTEDQLVKSLQNKVRISEAIKEAQERIEYLNHCKENGFAKQHHPLMIRGRVKGTLFTLLNTSCEAQFNHHTNSLGFYFNYWFEDVHMVLENDKTLFNLNERLHNEIENLGISTLNEI